MTATMSCRRCGEQVDDAVHLIAHTIEDCPDPPGTVAGVPTLPRDHADLLRVFGTDERAEG